MLLSRCGWIGCGGDAEKHVVFAVRVHDAAAATGGALPTSGFPNRFDLCHRHVVQVQLNYMEVEIRDLTTRLPNTTP